MIETQKPYRWLRGVQKLLWRLLTALFWLLAALHLFGWLFLLCVEQDPKALPIKDAVHFEATQIFVIQRGWHSALVIPQPKGLDQGPVGLESAPYLEFAFGDRRWFQGGDSSTFNALRAILWPTDGVIYLAGHPSLEALRADRMQAFSVDAATAKRLTARLCGEIAVDEMGKRRPPLPLHPNWPGHFYPAMRRYIHWHNCNEWTAAQLAAVGLFQRWLPAYSPSHILVQPD